jgi:acetyl esterase/lipase
MLHGAGGAGPFTPTTWWAPAVARQGAVVFVPSWETAPTTSVEAFRAGATAPAGYLACAVRFARAEAERYGGDPSSVTLFGWSGGANEASMVAFADPQVPEGCLAGSGSVVPDNLVLFDGAWLLVGDEWDDILEEDPSAHDLITPWSYLEGTHRRMPVAILTSNDPGLFRSTEDLDRWFPSRDPTGEFRRDLEQQGAFDDGRLDVADVSELLFRRLQGLGFPAAFHLLPDSSHGSLSDEAYEILFDAILHPVGL